MVVIVSIVPYERFQNNTDLWELLISYNALQRKFHSLNVGDCPAGHTPADLWCVGLWSAWPPTPIPSPFLYLVTNIT